MFTAAGQTFQQQYPTGGQAISKSKFIINTFHQPKDFLFPSEFRKIHSLAVDLSLVKIKQLPSVDRVKNFVIYKTILRTFFCASLLSLQSL